MCNQTISSEQNLASNTLAVATVAAFMQNGIAVNLGDVRRKIKDIGTIELVSEMVSYAAYAAALAKVGDQLIGFRPGVFEYEVAGPFGNWFGLQIIATRHVPSTDHCKEFLLREVFDFFNPDETEEIELKVALAVVNLENPNHVINDSQQFTSLENHFAGFNLEKLEDLLRETEAKRDSIQAEINQLKDESSISKLEVGKLYKFRKKNKVLLLKVVAILADWVDMKILDKDGNEEGDMRMYFDFDRLIPA